MSDQSPYLVLVMQAGPQVGKVFIIQDGINRIGSDPASDIVLADNSISPKHARMVMQPDGVWIQDLGSTHGTFVNGQPLTASVWLQPGDRIQLGVSVVLGLQAGGAGSTSISSRSRQRIWRRAASVIILLLALAGTLAVGVRAFFQPGPIVASPFIGPTIRIYKPASNTNAAFNTPLPIYASVRDEQGVHWTELWANGRPAVARESALPTGENPFTFRPLWAPLTTGEHRLSFQAFSTDGRRNTSDTILVDALQNYTEGDSLPFFAEEGDTLITIAEQVERSVEEIKVLNPHIEAIAAAQNKSPDEVIIPAGAAIAVPADVDPATLPPPEPPVIPEFPPRPPFGSGDGETGSETSTFADDSPTIAGCRSILPLVDERWQLHIVDFQPPGSLPDLAPEDAYCYPTIGAAGRTTAFQLENLAGASGEFSWPRPVEPVPIEFTCLTKPRPPDRLPVDLGRTETIVTPEQWLSSEPITVRSSDGGFGLSFQISPANESTLPATAGDLQPPDKPNPIPASSCWAIWPSEREFSACRNGQTLTWSWQPDPRDPNRPACFEVRERVTRADHSVSERMAIPPILADPQFLKNGVFQIPAIVPDLLPQRHDCDTQADYIIRVMDSSGKFADSEPFSLAGPACTRRAAVTFEKLKVLNAPGTGWERYSVYFFANDAQRPQPPEEKFPWEDAPGLPQADNSYFIGDYFNNSLDVKFGEQDTLTIGGNIAKLSNRRWDWCQPELVLSAEQIQELIAGGEALEATLPDRNRACEVDVTIMVTEP